MTTEPRENLEAILRQLAFPVGVDVNEHRRLRTSPPPNESPEDGEMAENWNDTVVAEFRANDGRVGGNPV